MKIYLDRNVEDVNLGALADDDLLVYDEATQKWVNKSLTVSGITLAQDGVTIASGVTTVNFVNASVVETTPGYITVTCSDILQVQVFS